jgi:hypothetical protein
MAFRRELEFGNGGWAVIRVTSTGCLTIDSMCWPNDKTEFPYEELKDAIKAAIEAAKDGGDEKKNS